MGTSLRLLQVEDSPADAELVRIELQRAGFDLVWERVDTEKAYVEALERDWDVILSDFQMPLFDGLRALAVHGDRKLDTPFIFVSGAIGEARAVEAMRGGARDYVLKDSLARLGPAVLREIDEALNRRWGRLAEERAERETRRLEMALDATGAALFEYAIPPGPDTFCSSRWTEILGEGVEQLERRHFPEDLWSRVHPDDLPVARAAHQSLVAGASPRLAVELRLRVASGAWKDSAIFAKATERDASGRATRVVGVMLDTTEQRRLEAQFRQAQKMEAVGRLAGGIAHDFNNVLTAVFGFGSIILEGLRPSDPLHKDMQDLLAAARRAESLTAQLLAFSRQRTVSPCTTDLGRLIEGIDSMLRRILGEDIDYSTQIAPGMGSVFVDPSAFEQVLVNLAVNARDAMAKGGKLTIEASDVVLDECYGPAHGAPVKPGPYVQIAISDNGSGMDEETQRRIFEPFFTTKGPGKGTGLGLATCYGIVKQAGGFIWVYSEPGKGTTFKVYFPRTADRPEPVVERPVGPVKQGVETILIAEDDAPVRRLAVRALERLGYKILEASNGGEALLVCEQYDEPIHLLITDVVMPIMSGKELASRLASKKPAMKVLFMSGYTPNAISHQGVLDAGVHLLQKPFAPDALARKVREVLDG